MRRSAPAPVRLYRPPGPSPCPCACLDTLSDSVTVNCAQGQLFELRYFFIDEEFFTMDRWVHNRRVDRMCLLRAHLGPDKSLAIPKTNTSRSRCGSPTSIFTVLKIDAAPTWNPHPTENMGATRE
jgi:hypothetical protein